jgi:hypothetical protein
VGAPEAVIDHSKLKVVLRPEPPLVPPSLQPAAPTEADMPDVEPVRVKTQCPVCHWGLVVTVTPVEVAG